MAMFGLGRTSARKSLSRAKREGSDRKKKAAVAASKTIVSKKSTPSDRSGAIKSLQAQAKKDTKQATIEAKRSRLSGKRTAATVVGRIKSAVGLDIRSHVTGIGGGTLADFGGKGDPFEVGNTSGATIQGVSAGTKSPRGRGGGNGGTLPVLPAIPLANKGSILTGPNGEVGKPTEEETAFKSVRRARSKRRVSGLS
jgi:hypothetical protein